MVRRKLSRWPLLRPTAAPVAGEVSPQPAHPFICSVNARLVAGPSVLAPGGGSAGAAGSAMEDLAGAGTGLAASDGRGLQEVVAHPVSEGSDGQRRVRAHRPGHR